MKPLEHIGLQCLYCDDLRDEIGGKTTIVGWYGGENIQLPPDGALLLPSIGVVGLVAMPLQFSYKSFKLELVLGDAILHSANIPQRTVEDMQASGNGSSTGKEIRIALKVANLQISDPAVLRLRVVVDEQEIHSNGLRFIRETDSKTQ